MRCAILRQRNWRSWRPLLRNKTTRLGTSRWKKTLRAASSISFLKKLSANVRLASCAIGQKRSEVGLTLFFPSSFLPHPSSFISMSDTFRIRRATAHDADIIAWHRARMFQDMGDVAGDAFEILRAKARTRLKEWLESGDYVGWLATPADESAKVVAGAGVQLQPILPPPLDRSTTERAGAQRRRRASPRGYARREPSISISEDRQGTIVNVFTEPKWRRRGIASLLLKEIITWSKNE